VPDSKFHRALLSQAFAMPKSCTGFKSCDK
jgi:hypothetical protein